MRILLSIKNMNVKLVPSGVSIIELNTISAHLNTIQSNPIEYSYLVIYTSAIYLLGNSATIREAER